MRGLRGICKCRDEASCNLVILCFSGINERYYWTFTVGQAGGNFQVMNIFLSIPKDAVDKDVTIQIAVSHNDQDRPPVNQSYSVVGPVIHCLPHGLHFKKTVALLFGCNLHLATQNPPPDLQVIYRYVGCLLYFLM